MTDFRALCAELIQQLQELHTMVWGEAPNLLDEDRGGSAYLDLDIEDVLEKARLALAQPEPEGPGPDDVTQLYYKHGGGDGMYGGMGEVNFEEAVEEALARWGRSATNVREQI
jgi:hypothetical protein